MYVSTYVLTVSPFRIEVVLNQKKMRSVFEIVKVTTIEDDSISSVASSSNARVYIGTNNGTLMVYELRHRDGDVGIVDETSFFFFHDVNQKTEQIRIDSNCAEIFTFKIIYSTIGGVCNA